jgi:hypothetical protein
LISCFFICLKFGVNFGVKIKINTRKEKILEKICIDKISDKTMIIKSFMGFKDNKRDYKNKAVLTFEG